MLHDEHMFALRRQCRAYGINGEGPYYVLKSALINEWLVHRRGRAGVYR